MNRVKGRAAKCASKLVGEKDAGRAGGVFRDSEVGARRNLKCKQRALGFEWREPRNLRSCGPPLSDSLPEQGSSEFGFTHQKRREMPELLSPSLRRISKVEPDDL